jgi:hypothetical protein
MKKILNNKITFTKWCFSWWSIPTIIALSVSAWFFRIIFGCLPIGFLIFLTKGGGVPLCFWIGFGALFTGIILYFQIISYAMFLTKENVLNLTSTLNDKFCTTMFFLFSIGFSYFQAIFFTIPFIQKNKLDYGILLNDYNLCYYLLQTAYFSIPISILMHIFGLFILYKLSDK